MHSSYPNYIKHNFKDFSVPDPGPPRNNILAAPGGAPAAFAHKNSSRQSRAVASERHGVIVSDRKLYRNR